MEKEFWVGKAADLESMKETLPAVEVKNHVVYVNPNFPELPLNLEEGQPTKLGMFLTPELKTEEQAYPLEVRKDHGRTGVLGRFIFQDVVVRLYRDIDLKGIGSSKLKNGKMAVAKPGYGQESIGLPPRYYGIMGLSAANHDRDVSEELLKEGVRTHRVVAIIAIDEIIDNSGNKLSIEEARKREVIAGPITEISSSTMVPESENDAPVIEVRAFGTRGRLSDLHPKGRSPKDFVLLDDARLLVARELNKKPEEFTEFEYLKWLAQAIGTNIGIMHKNRWSLGRGTHLQNLTLDGRIVDFDGVEKLEGENSSQLLEDEFRNRIAPYFESFMRMGAADFSRSTIFSPTIRKRGEILKELESAYWTARKITVKE